MGEETAAQVIGKDGLRGRLIDSVHPLSNKTVRVKLDTGKVITIPSSMLHGHSPGVYEVSMGPGDLERYGGSPATRESEQVIVPVLAEELLVDKEAHVTGGVRVHRRTEEHDETVEMSLIKQAADVRRVLIEREVNGPLPVRYENETTIIPIVQEELVVTKRFILKEEIHVTRTQREELHKEQVALSRQFAEVERTDAKGQPLAIEPEEPVNYRARMEEDAPWIDERLHPPKK